MDSWTRISALVLRHFYIIRQSWVRIIETLYWPSVTMVIWGFVSSYFGQQEGNTVTYALAAILGAVMLWDVMHRVQLGMSMFYLEDLWARNLGHLFVSPLRPWEWWTSMMIVSLSRVLLGTIPAMFLAIPFYGFSIFDLGLPLIAFFLNLLVMGWWLGFIITSILMKAGPSAEGLAWALSFLLIPFAGVYHPTSILPLWMQDISQFVPASHIFNGLRHLVQFNEFDSSYLYKAMSLNVLYLILAAMILSWAFHDARKQGTLLQTGE